MKKCLGSTKIICVVAVGIICTKEHEDDFKKEKKKGTT